MNAKASKVRIFKVIVSRYVDGRAPEWPPTCLGFFYQPERPVQQSASQDKAVAAPNGAKKQLTLRNSHPSQNCSDPLCGCQSTKCNTERKE